MPMMNPYKGKHLLTYKKFVFVRIVYWIYTIIWIGIWIYALFSWSSIPWYYKILLFIFLLFFAPSIGDLIQSYDHYKREWEEVNKSATTDKNIEIHN